MVAAKFKKAPKPVRIVNRESAFEPDQDIIDLLEASEAERQDGLDNAYFVQVKSTPVGRRRGEKGEPMVEAHDDVTALAWVRKHATHLGYGLGGRASDDGKAVIIWTTKPRERKEETAA